MHVNYFAKELNKSQNSTLSGLEPGYSWSPKQALLELSAAVRTARIA